MAGEGIQLEDIESILNSHLDIKHRFVIPIVDKEFGHCPVAVIESDNQKLVTSLNLWLVRRLVAFQRPIAYYLLLRVLIDNAGIKLSRHNIK
ncbi:MAG: hypothetical protein ACL7BU_10200 [Candidatus Phlomobacter fragariae]